MAAGAGGWQGSCRCRQAGRHRQAHAGRHWQAQAGTGRRRQAQAGTGRHRQAQAGTGRRMRAGRHRRAGTCRQALTASMLQGLTRNAPLSDGEQPTNSLTTSELCRRTPGSDPCTAQRGRQGSTRGGAQGKQGRAGLRGPSSSSRRQQPVGGAGCGIPAGGQASGRAIEQRPAPVGPAGTRCTRMASGSCRPWWQSPQPRLHTRGQVQEQARDRRRHVQAGGASRAVLPSPVLPSAQRQLPWGLAQAARALTPPVPSGSPGPDPPVPSARESHLQRCRERCARTGAAPHASAIPPARTRARGTVR